MLLRIVDGIQRRWPDALHIPQMKEFVGRDTRQVFIRMDANRGRVRVLHATAAGSFAKVENERVALEWSSAHELQFVLTDALQVLLNPLLFPVVSVNYDLDVGRYSGQVKLLKPRDLNRPVRKLVVGLCHDRKHSGTAYL